MRVERVHGDGCEGGRELGWRGRLRTLREPSPQGPRTGLRPDFARRAHAGLRAWAASTRRAFAHTLAPALALALVVLAGGLAAGCGSSQPTGTSADPAGVVPSYTPVYIGAVVRPEGGKLEDEALAAGRALTGQRNPYARLLGVLHTPGSAALDYNRDVKPWLGENAGLFFTALGSTQALAKLLQQGLLGTGGGAEWPFGTDGAQGAIVLDTSDLAAAKKFVSTQAAHAGAHTSAYKGVSYETTTAAGGVAFALIHRLVVLGTEAGVRAVIDTSQSGASLQGTGPYAQLQTVAPAGALGHVYQNPAALEKARLAAGSGVGEGAAQSPPALLEELGGSRPLNVSLVPAAKSIALDADIGPAPAASSGSGAHQSGLVGALATGSQALGELPGESWLAAGLGDTGGAPGGALEGLGNLLSLASTLGASGAGAPLAPASPQVTLSVQGVLEGMLTPLNLLAADTPQAKRDYRAWMGEAGVFASGTTVLELKAGVVIDSTDPAASRAAVGKLASALNRSGAEASRATIAGTDAAIEVKVTGLPVTLVIADGLAQDGQTKFVMGVGESSITSALRPSSTMSGSAAYTAAQSALGEGIKPSLQVDFATMLSLLEGVGLSEDPTIAPYVPFLRNSTTLAGGGRSLGGGMERLRLVLGLRPGAG
jgi:Protein of unknown function (DUF3352)